MKRLIAGVFLLASLTACSTAPSGVPVSKPVDTASSVDAKGSEGSSNTAKPETKATPSDTKPKEADSAKPAVTANPDFRNITWGMTRDQVKAAETLTPVHESEEGLFYEDTLDNKKVVLGYLFADDKLIRASYLLADTHVNDNLYITDFEGFKKLLLAKYGTPTSDKTVWYDDLYKDNPDDWGMAVSAGHLAYETMWSTPKTDIAVRMKGDNFKINMAIIFTSKELKDLGTQKSEQESKDKL